MGVLVEARRLVRYFYVDAGVNGAVGITPDQREIDRGNKRGAAQISRSKARKSTQKLDRLQRANRHRHLVASANRRGAGARNTRPSQLPKNKRAANPRTRPKSSALPPKVTSGATVAFPDSQDQHSVAASDRDAGSASAPAPELSSHSVSGPVTARRRTRSMEANGRGSKRTRVARGSSAPNETLARSSAKTQTPSDLAGSGPITELDRGLARIGAMAQECHVGGLFASVYSFDNAAENIPEDEDDPYDTTMASEYPSSVYVGLEKEPEAAVFPKQLLPIRPPIWAQVRRVGYGCPNHVGNMVSSHDRKCASPLTPSGAFKVAFIIYTISSKDTFLAGTPPGQFSVGSQPNLADILVAMTFSTTAEGLSFRMGKGFYIPTLMFIEAGSP